MATDTHIDIILDGPPGPDSPRFIEVDDPSGRSLKASACFERQDGLWVVRVPIAATNAKQTPTR